jgi:hypothetical protein
MKRRLVTKSPDPGNPYGDPSALAHMATSSDSPPLDLSPTAVEAHPAPADLGPCPCCGQQRPNPLNTFATGSKGHPSLHIRERHETDAPDPQEG